MSVLSQHFHLHQKYAHCSITGGRNQHQHSNWETQVLRKHGKLHLSGQSFVHVNDSMSPKSPAVLKRMVVLSDPASLGRAEQKQGLDSSASGPDFLACHPHPGKLQHPCWRLTDSPQLKFLLPGSPGAWWVQHCYIFEILFYVTSS